MPKSSTRSSPAKHLNKRPQPPAPQRPSTAAPQPLFVAGRGNPIVREADGLALSSRNAYLGAEERIAAASLSSALRLATAAYAAGERRPEQLRNVFCGRLEAEPLARVEYAEVVDPETFRPPGTLAVLAVRIGSTRLIDKHDLSREFPG